MEKLGLGTKSTRASIIERLYQVKYVQNDPIEPSQLGIAVIDALDKFAPHITHAEMTAELERSMDRIAEGSKTKAEVVETSPQPARPGAGEPHAPFRGGGRRAFRRRGRRRLRGAVPEVRQGSATEGEPRRPKSMFIGCAGWPDCDVTYPLPKGKIEAVPEKCPTCGMPQVKVTAFRSKPRVQCIDPACALKPGAGGRSGQVPRVRGARPRQEPHRPAQPAHAEALHHLRELRRVRTRATRCPSTATSFPPRRCASTAARPWWSSRRPAGPGSCAPNFDCPGKEEEEKAKAEKKSGRSKGGRKAASKK